MPKRIVVTTIRLGIFLPDPPDVITSHAIKRLHPSSEKLLGCSTTALVLLIFPLFNLMWPAPHHCPISQIAVVPQRLTRLYDVDIIENWQNMQTCE